MLKVASYSSIFSFFICCQRAQNACFIDSFIILLLSIIKCGIERFHNKRKRRKNLSMRYKISRTNERTKKKRTKSNWKKNEDEPMKEELKQTSPCNLLIKTNRTNRMHLQSAKYTHTHIHPNQFLIQIHTWNGMKGSFFVFTGSPDRVCVCLLFLLEFY